jgi:hypothetical protein
MTGRLSALPEEISPTIGFVGASGVLTLYTEAWPQSGIHLSAALNRFTFRGYSQLRDR